MAATVVAVLVGAAALPAAAQDWPARTVTMIVPSAAGGTGDVYARILAPRMSEVLGQTVVVENVGGAGGMNASARVAKAAPDGYLFVYGNIGTHAHNHTLYKKLPYNAATDFTPVILVAETPSVLVVRKDFPATNLREFITYAKANQAKLQYGTPGAGSPPHLACVLLNAAIGIKITHIPYRGGAPAMQDLIAGRNDYQCPGTPVAAPPAQSGLIKAIAMMSRQRSPTLPSLATAHEQGLTEFEAVSWNGFFFPRGTPPAIVAQLNRATATAMDTPSVQERLRELGAIVVPPARRAPSYLQAHVEREIRKWASVINAAGITPQ